MHKLFTGALVALALTICGATALADPSPVPSAVAVAQTATGPDFLTQVFQAIQGFGGMSWILKISTILTLAIASLKSSFVNKVLWSKLGAFQAYLAPALGLLLGVVTLGLSGHITLQGLTGYLFAGAGAIALHEILDTVKAIPGIGPGYVQVINAVESVLGGPGQTSGTPVAAAAPASSSVPPASS